MAHPRLSAYLLAALVACETAAPSPAALSFDRFVRATYPGVAVLHPVVYGDGTDGPSWKSTCHWSKLEVRAYDAAVSKLGYPFYGVLEGTVEDANVTSGRILRTRVVRVTFFGETATNAYRWACAPTDGECTQLAASCMK